MQAAQKAGRVKSAELELSRVFIALGAGLGALVVALGAFGAHALKETLEASMLANFETGVRYHVYHALALVLLGVWMERGQLGVPAKYAGALFALGILLFSGSLYLMAFTGLRWLGAITPVGGAAFIAGWVLMALSALKKPA